MLGCLAFLLLRVLPPAAACTLAGLPVAASGGLACEATAVLWPVATAVAAALAAQTVRTFRRQDL